MNLSDFIVADAIVPNLESDQRDGVIAELVNSLAKSGGIDSGNIDEIIKELIDRENQGSTGIGKGIAVPHIKHQSIKKITGTVGSSKEGVDFSALDKAPVYSILLLLSPIDDPDRHLEAMETLFAHLQRDMFRKFLRQAETVDAVVDLLKEADETQQETGL